MLISCLPMIDASFSADFSVLTHADVANISVAAVIVMRFLFMIIVISIYEKNIVIQRFVHITPE